MELRPAVIRSMRYRDAIAALLVCVSLGCQPRQSASSGSPDAGGLPVRVRIISSQSLHVTFRNDAGADVYLGHCGTELRGSLEKKRGDAWVPMADVPCLSILLEAERIASRESRSFDMLKGAADTPDSVLTGTFRVVVPAYTSPDAVHARDRSLLVPLSLRVSGPFRLGNDTSALAPDAFPHW